MQSVAIDLENASTRLALEYEAHRFANQILVNTYISKWITNSAI